MKVDEVLAKATDPLKASMVYAEPLERDGVTVIVAARFAGGGGGGNGMDERGRNGEGGGIGITAKPAGAYVIKDGRVRWEPAVDVNRIVTVLGAVAVAALMAVSRILRAR